ncbi:hypothetical protein [Nocardioides euryhalodurans]|uniref:Uncharacterized protein n=1 Tax=Nocardioides euryhalodurans TaxID=2518370 RepID=A0A4P7GMQ4_9ACTN|nr:hypothetical protein [Nocardioides euryhalodurans]QBR93164.1 hypothetical protein EXE57_13480 [Nocardioides euryhalodurans]
MTSTDVSTSRPHRPRHAVGRFLVAAVVLTAASFAAHWVWLGWDVEYDGDPSTGAVSGPYQVWQVAGCVLTLLGVAVVAGVRGHFWAATVVMPVAYTTALSLQAQASDESGLWLVGAILVLVGMSLAVPLVAGLASAVSRSVRGRRAIPTR